MGRTKQIMEQRRKDAEARNAIYANLPFKERLARQTPNGKAAKKLLKRLAEQEASLAKGLDNAKKKEFVPSPIETSHESSHKKAKQ